MSAPAAPPLPDPGTPEAEADGCTCGEQGEAAAQGFYVYTEGCPVHWDAVMPR